MSSLRYKQTIRNRRGQEIRMIKKETKLNKQKVKKKSKGSKQRVDAEDV
jgi:hypothetical protein